MANKIVKLKDGDNYLYPYANFMAIDTSNVISTNPSSPYVATQDCFAKCYIDGGSIKIDNTQVLYFGGGGTDIIATVPVKKGQSVTYNTNYGTYSLTIYGIKY